METNSERRRRKLADLCSKRGITKVAGNAGLNWASLDQIIKKTLLPPKKDGTRSVKNLGDDAARKIERAEQLGEGWFDSSDGAIPSQTGVTSIDHEQIQLAIEDVATSAEIKMIAAMFATLPDDPVIRGTVTGQIAAIISAARESPTKRQMPESWQDTKKTNTA